MRYLSIHAADSEISMSRLVLGTYPFGTKTSRKNSFGLMDEYSALGGNTIDTARVYCDWIQGGESASEKTVGEWIKIRNNRQNIILVTKGGHPRMDSMEQSRLSERELTEDMNLSLQALKTDYIDLYLLHRDDRNLPVEQIMDTLDQFVTQGKTRAIGVSNWSADRIFQANRYAHSAGKTPISVSQIQWSYALCTPKMFHDESLICMTEKEYHQYLNMKIPVMAFSSQAKGFFTKAAQDGIQQVGAELKEFVTETNSKRFQILEEYCAKTGCSFAAAALRYLIYNPLPGVAIIGSSNIAQLRDSMIQCEENFCPEAIKEFWQIDSKG